MLATHAFARLGRLVTALVLAAALVPAAARASSTPAAPKPDYSGWQLLLSRYCLSLPGKSPLQDTRFDYEQLYVDENIWTLKRSDRLARIRAQLLATPPSALEPRERLAWALNTYNFLVVEQATLHLLVPGRQFLRYQSPNDIVIEGAPFFRSPIVTIEGRELSIEEFGRRYVYGDSTPQLEFRATPGDPRLAFAMCMGYAGGAPLAPRAFRTDSLEAQLDQCVRRALAQPRFATADPRTGELVLSEFLSDHRVDFGGDPNRAIPFVEKHTSGDVKSVIRKFKLTAATRFAPVDTRFNQFERPKTAPPVRPAGAPSAGS